MAVPLPPWLDVKPSDFVSAAEGGARTGLEQRGQNIELSKLATDAALQRQEIQQRGAIASMQASAQAAANEREHQLRQTELSMNAAMEQQKLGMAQQQLQLDTQAAAQKFAAQQQYQQLVADGMDPIQAALQVGPGLLGESVSGLGTLKRAQAMTGFSPNEITMPSGATMIQRGPGQWTQARLPTEWTTDKLPDGTEVQRNTQTGEIKSVPGTMTESQRENMELRKELQKNNIINKVMDEDVKDALSSGTGIDKSWNDRKRKTYVAAKKQLDAVDSGSASTGTVPNAQYRYNPDTGQAEPVKTERDIIGYGEGE